MAIQRTLPQSIIPDLPRSHKVITKDGDMVPEWKLFFDQLVLALQTNFKTEGWLVPKLGITQINNIAARYTPLIGLPLPPGLPDITGQIVFDSTNLVTKQFIITYNATTPPTIATAQWWMFCESATGTCFELLGP